MSTNPGHFDCYAGTLSDDGIVAEWQRQLRARDDVITQARQILIHAHVSEESAEHVLLPRYLVGALRDALIQLDR